MLVGVALPFLVAAVVVAARSWTPAGDQALQLLKIDQVGSSRTPLVGAWSRWGWNHPGPWPTYVLAPFTWVFGTVGALIGTLMVNMASLLVAVAMGRRRGGLPAATLVALMGLLVGFAQGPTVMMDLWNPFVGLFPLYALCVAAWSVGDGDWMAMPAAAGFASFCVQAHVGYLPVVAAVSVVAVLLAVGSNADAPEPVGQSPSPGRRPLGITAAVLSVAWLPPLVEQFRGDGGNVSELARYALDSPEPPIGWSVAARVASHELGVPGGWITGREFDLFAPSTTPIGALIVVVAAALLGALAWRAGCASAARLSAIGLVAAFAAFLATSRIVGQLFDYLLVWWWAVGATVWLSIAWSATELLARRRPGWARGSTVVAAFATAVVAIGLSARAVGADLPVAQQSAAVEALVEQIQPQLPADASYLVEWRDSFGFGYVGTGIFAALAADGFDVVVPNGSGPAFDAWQLGDEADQRLVVSTRDDDLLYPPPDGSLVVATFDPLTESERAEADELWSTIVRQAGEAASAPGLVGSPVGRDELIDAGAGPELVERLRTFWDAGPAFVVYLAPGTADR